MRPVTELARLTLLPPNTLTTPSLLSKLAKAKQAMEAWTGRNFAYVVPCDQDPDEPTTVYIIGEWASVHQHIHDWIPSAENQELIEMLKDDVKVDWMIHIDRSHVEMGFPFTEAALSALRSAEAAWYASHSAAQEARWGFSFINPPMPPRPVTNLRWSNLPSDIFFSIDRFVFDDRKGEYDDLFGELFENKPDLRDLLEYNYAFDDVWMYAMDVQQGKLSEAMGGQWIVERPESGKQEFALIAGWKGEEGRRACEEWRKEVRKEVERKGGVVGKDAGLCVRKLDV